MKDQDLTIGQTPEGYFNVYCNVCGKQVDNVIWERNVHTVRSFLGRERFVSAGYATITIRCHSETSTHTVSG